MICITLADPIWPSNQTLTGQIVLVLTVFSMMHIFPEVKLVSKLVLVNPYDFI